MRSTLILSILAAILLLAGCNRYDRELLGDPEPEPPETAEYAPPEETPPEENGEEEARDVGMFDELKFYGTWHWISPYGWVWRPIVVSTWQPFLYGHWIWTQYGWMWVSYDPWGWATAHYGYWVIDFTYGWVWIPDYTWSPCRCDWIIYDDYICWSPVPPPGVRFKDPWEKDGTQWVAVPAGKFKEPGIGNYRTTPKFKSGYSDRTLRRSAPDEHDIERIGWKEIPVVEVRLDRSVVGEREFARVQLPPDQQSIVDEQRVKMKEAAGESGKKSDPAKVKHDRTPPPPGDTRSDDPRTRAKSKSEVKKDSGSKKDADKKDPPKYKERKAEEKMEAKKDEKSRG